MPEVTRYKTIFEDETIILQLGEEFLRVYTKLDSSAYDIPLEPIREAILNDQTNNKRIRD